MSEDIYLADHNLNGVKLSAEQALLKGLSRWKGWFCALGIDNLHITADGNAYGATCKVGGLLNNIYDHFGNFPEQYSVCTKSICSCGSDMQLRKTKNFDEIPKAIELKSSHINFDGSVAEFNFVGPLYEEGPRVSITWDLGRRCNYSCSYCNSSISNNYESHKSKGSLLFAYNKLKDYFIKNRRVKFIFTGGEPTLNPAYLDLVKLIHLDGHLVHTQTNGSLTPEYYSELIKYSLIGISVHLQFFNKDRLFKNIQAIVSITKSDPRYQFQWFGIRIMAPPSQLDTATELFQNIEKLKQDLNANFDLVMSPVYDKDNNDQLQNYTPEESQLLSLHV